MAIEIFLDSANLSEIEFYADKKAIMGFTTNPSLMRKSGISNVNEFARRAVSLAAHKSISFEISTQDREELKKQSLRIHEYGQNVFVKIPIVDTYGNSLETEILDLLKRGVKINVTAVFTLNQIRRILSFNETNTKLIISCFAGRIADTQRDPIPIVREIRKNINKPNISLLWASAREVLNLSHAESAGADIITLTSDLLNKISLRGKDLREYSIETSQMFFRDAAESGLHF
jgi:transaldolase